MDRFLVDVEWDSLFFYAIVRYLDENISDYFFILVELNYIGRGRYKKRKRGFKFENMWVLERRCEDVIK